MNVAVLVPRRGDGGHRDRLWEFCRAWWLGDHPDWPIVEGEHADGPFNRSAAIDTAAELAGAWDVALIIDSDTICNPDAVRAAVDVAAATHTLVVAGDERIMLNRAGTAKILDGYRGPWRVKNMVETVFTDGVSSCVAVSRRLWDQTGGFDEAFVGWGFEDSAFQVACETVSGRPMVRLSSELFHLWHQTARNTKDATHTANLERLARYRAAHGDRAAVAALREENATTPVLGSTRIPRILHRTVPAETSEQVEEWWAEFGRLHPGWDLRTHREPLDPVGWPLTGDLWASCANGAQKAGLIRLECLVTHGGVYVDSDFEPFRSFEPLTRLSAFAAWEDATCVPDALLACEAGHPAFVECLEKARSVIEGGGDAWQSGPGVTTEVLPNRADVLLLPPGAFYAVHYLEKRHLGRRPAPFEFARHHWHGSWLSPSQRQSIARRQRR